MKSFMGPAKAPTSWRPHPSLLPGAHSVAGGCFRHLYGCQPYSRDCRVVGWQEAPDLHSQILGNAVLAGSAFAVDPRVWGWKRAAEGARGSRRLWYRKGEALLILWAAGGRISTTSVAAKRCREVLAGTKAAPSQSSLGSYTLV